jgi:3-methyladenine DNA glycosylase AlkD
MNQTTPNLDEILKTLNSLADPAVKASQERFGIQVGRSLGISLYTLRDLAKGIHDHRLALSLWDTGIHEARMLAAMIDEPEKVTLQQMETWVSEFDSWDICDIATDEVFIHTPYILDRITAWSTREEEFVKRAAFASMAALVVHRKDIPDIQITSFFTLIEQASGDPRNFVKKAVNWALRNIGKFRLELRKQAWTLAEKLSKSEDKTARWIGKDAVREFTKKYGGRDETENSH